MDTRGADPWLQWRIWRLGRYALRPATEWKGIYQFFGSAFADRKLVARDIAVHVNGNTAWVEFYWHYTATQAKDGANVETDGRESQVYRKTTAGMAHGTRALFGPSDGVPT